jgi:hypothetical protein
LEINYRPEKSNAAADALSRKMMFGAWHSSVWCSKTMGWTLVKTPNQLPLNNNRWGIRIHTSDTICKVLAYYSTTGWCSKNFIYNCNSLKEFHCCAMEGHLGISIIQKIRSNSVLGRNETRCEEICASLWHLSKERVSSVGPCRAVATIGITTASVDIAHQRFHRGFA